MRSGCTSPMDIKWANIKKYYRKCKATMQNNNMKTDNDRDMLDMANLFESTNMDNWLTADIDTNASSHATSNIDLDVLFEFRGDAELETDVRADIIVDNVAPEEEKHPEVITTYKTDNLLPDHIISKKVAHCGTNTHNNKANGFKRKCKHYDDGRTAKNKAMTEYYVLKKNLLEVKADEIYLQNKKLKLELEVLKQKNELLKRIEPINLLKIF